LRYIKSLDEATKAVTDCCALKHNFLSYGIVIYVPVTDSDSTGWEGQQQKKTNLGSDASYKIDLSNVIASEKKKLCPRILLLSTWADVKFGFAGAERVAQYLSCFRWKELGRILLPLMTFPKLTLMPNLKYLRVGNLT
jgi:hypothetical protein